MKCCQQLHDCVMKLGIVTFCVERLRFDTVIRTVVTFLWLSPFWRGPGPSFEQTWIPFTQGWFVPSLVEFGPVVLEKKSKMWKVNGQTTDNRWSEKLTWTFGSGELKRSEHIQVHQKATADYVSPFTHWKVKKGHKSVKNQNRVMGIVSSDVNVDDKLMHNQSANLVWNLPLNSEKSCCSDSSSLWSTITEITKMHAKYNSHEHSTVLWRSDK